MADRQIVCSYCTYKRCFMGDLSQALECSRMLDDAVKAEEMEEKFEVLDVAEIVTRALA